MRKRCSVLLSTCDKYEDAWYPFFSLLKKHWKCPYTIYINTESKNYKDSSLDIKAINQNDADLSWSSRLKHALKQIDTDYIIFLLEDFFFLDSVNQYEIEKCIELMEKDKSISVIDFEQDPVSEGAVYNHTDYCYRKTNSMYFLNCQASIWRRRDLIKYLSPYESPWQFEIYGSQRVKLYNKVFLLRQSNQSEVFPYNVNWSTGYGIHGGKWLPSTVDLLESNGIDVDYNNMGFYRSDTEVKTCPPPKVTALFRLQYLMLSGGDIAPRMSIGEQVKYSILHPKEFFSMVKNKILRCVKHDFFY